MTNPSRKDLFAVMVSAGLAGLGINCIIHGPELWQRVLGGIGTLIFVGLLWRLPKVDKEKL